MRALRALDLPPVWLAGFGALAWAQSRFAPADGLPDWVGTLGLGLVAVGMLLIAAAGLEFLRHRTTIVPYETPRDLIDTGIYRLTRNPIYLGDAAILAGAILLWGAWPSLILVPVFMAIIARRFIRWEEARLRETFGDRAAAYMRRVRRWI